MYWNLVAMSFFVYFLAGGSGFASEGIPDAPPLVWWSPAPVERLGDGRASQVLLLMASPELTAPPEAWLRVTPLRRFNQLGEPEEAHWRKAQWVSSEPWSLSVQAGEYVKVDIFAKGEIEGRPHFAQTRLLLYGRSTESENSSEVFVEPPNWPEFHMSSSGEFYWPQTGHEFTFALQNQEAADGNLEVWSGRGEFMARINASAEKFKYTPAHDPTLDKAGYAAGKPLIFLARNSRGSTANYTLVVHRSRMAGLDKNAGVAVFMASFLLCCLAAGLARLKVRPCW